MTVDGLADARQGNDVDRKRFVIFGTGGFGRELLSPALRMLAGRAASGGTWSLCFASDTPNGEVLGFPHLATRELDSDDEVVIAVGDGKLRRDLSGRVPGVSGMLVAPSAVIGAGVDIGEGGVFCDFSMVTASARIGVHFQCNIYSYVAHDCVIGDFVTFAPRVCCNGNVHIGDGAYIGTGAVLKQGTPDRPLVIGRDAVVGMGAVVTKDVAPSTVVIGNPARLMTSG